MCTGCEGDYSGLDCEVGKLSFTEFPFNIPHAVDSTTQIRSNLYDYFGPMPFRGFLTDFLWYLLSCRIFSNMKTVLCLFFIGLVGPSLQAPQAGIERRTEKGHTQPRSDWIQHHLPIEWQNLKILVTEHPPSIRKVLTLMDKHLQSNSELGALFILYSSQSPPLSHSHR